MNFKKTFYENQQKSKKTIFYLISLLSMLYFVFIYIIMLITYYYLFTPKSKISGMPVLSDFRFVPGAWFVGLAFFGAVAAVFFQYKTKMKKIVMRIIKKLNARPADITDSYHKRFLNTVIEMEIASGTKIPAVYVIPDGAMNAFAMDDGVPCLFVTEGIISKMNREEQQAVSGHLAAQIACGDVKANTILMAMSSFLGFISETVNASSNGSSDYGTRHDFPWSSSRRRGGSGGGGAILFIALILITNAAYEFFSSILKMLISRERKFLADAIAVEFTRNSHALASALYKIKIEGDNPFVASIKSITPLCFESPALPMDNKSGFFSDLFSVHPPVEKRIEKITGAALENFKSIFKERKKAPPAPEKETKRYLAHKDNKWIGPFYIAELVTLRWLRPDTYICEEGSENVITADILAAVKPKEKEEEGGSFKCPDCGGSFKDDYYEGVVIKRCSSCAASLVTEEKLKRIILRQEFYISDADKQEFKKKQDEFSKLSVKEKQFDKLKKEVKHNCPKCLKPMQKTFYTYNIPVVVDKCFLCQLVFLNRRELEYIQVASEK